MFVNAREASPSLRAKRGSPGPRTRSHGLPHYARKDDMDAPTNPCFSYKKLTIKYFQF